MKCVRLHQIRELLSSSMSPPGSEKPNERPGTSPCQAPAVSDLVTSRVCRIVYLDGVEVGVEAEFVSSVLLQNNPEVGRA
jgi:hypothetical protein